MNVLVAGASGATGRLLVTQLLNAGHQVKIIVRMTSNIPGEWQQHSQVNIIRTADITAIPVQEMAEYLRGCQAVALCLGHTMSFKGIYGKPTRLVTHVVQLLCAAITQNAPEKPVRVVLMNTAGNSNRDLNEPVSFTHKLVIGLLRLLLPPHADNEQAADYLRVKTGKQHPFIEWVALRPDTLINQEAVTPFSLHASPVRSALFNAGQTSRINVAHCMCRLITDDTLWHQWKGQMPVIYNS
ncbi:NAD(P)-dependent oxidoreductase [Chitinophaga solisilvae]|uniref:NAD(P)-dependent oxidoreductase n=1 Tax=Chitinophaga solisilvae TaxID=1233460 RepID=UPI00136CD752|nr:NAD(P)-binding oxidoreductase [Chitinophaga solisilvae]